MKTHRNKLVVFAILAALVLALCPVMVTMAGTVLNITITAQGSEIDVSCNRTAWNVGTVHLSDNINTGTSWGLLTNSGSEAVDVTIAGRDMKNAGSTITWTFDNTGVAGVATFGMWAGLDGNDTPDILILEVGDTLEKLVDELATGTQDFDLWFYAPTATLGNDSMEMVGAGGTPADSPRGLVLTGSID
jgi:hypothetical protein